ncbi:MAG: L,D-transpeptidase [Armatimonadetes bacterium]|jgi:hypothetical protein|nr:L,D-transpeptidase [Armatimonadota bacterium]
MSGWKWIGIGALMAFLATAAPAQAGKVIVVDYDAGLVYPLEDGKLVRGPIITNNGQVFKRKYLGTFHISEKQRHKRSNMYNTQGNPIAPGETGAAMPYWMRLGNTAQGFHYSALFSAEGPRHRSRGCYRLSKESAVWLFGWAPLGTPVHIVKTLAGSRFAWLNGVKARPMAAQPRAAVKVAARALGHYRVGAAAVAWLPRREAPGWAAV